MRSRFRGRQYLYLTPTFRSSAGHPRATPSVGQSQYEGDISALRAAAYQAWYEHQPVRRSAMPDADGPKVYRRAMWGDLAQIDIVDGRQYRSIPPCGWGEADPCAAGYDPSITMLGAEQEQWLYDGLRTSRARWNVLGNNVMLGRLDHDGDAGDRLWHDAWDGFPGRPQSPH